jgi:hypothetical protein
MLRQNDTLPQRMVSVTPAGHHETERLSGIIWRDGETCRKAYQGMSPASMLCNASTRPPSAVAIVRTFSSIMPIYEC